MVKSVALVVLSVLLLIGGFFLFASADGSAPGWQAPTFFAGIVCVAAAFAIPLAVLPASRR